MEAVQGFQKSAVIRSAIELDVFTRIAGGYHTAETLASKCGTSIRGMRILCDGLVVLRLLNKSAGLYLLTDESRVFLDRSSDRYIGDAIDFLMSPHMLASYSRFTAAVKRGGTTDSGRGALEPEHSMWKQFARGMAPLMHTTILKLRELAVPAGRVLDIAAGHGLFGVRILEADLAARVVAVDWPGVLELAQENAARAGVALRWSALPGSAFDVDFGTGYDTVLLPNFLHHFSRAECVSLLKKVHTALAPKGRLIIVEHVPEEDRVHPSAPAWFAVMMLATTPGGDAYTLSEYVSMLGEAGFGEPETHDVPGAARTILVSRPTAGPR